jgi:hypothetical protein
MIKKWLGNVYDFKDGTCGRVVDLRMCQQRVNLTLDTRAWKGEDFPESPLYLTEHEIELNVREAA